MEEHPIEVLPQEQRYPELDSLRGIAAATVVFLHFHDLWVDQLPSPHGLAEKLALKSLQPFYAGNAAVYVFFVLSGFVLALPFLRGKRQTYVRYALRRVIRIYGPYLGALLMGIALNQIFWHASPLPGTWASHSWRQPADARLIVQHLFLIGHFDTRRYDFVIWTLVQEMRASLIFPLLFVGILRMKKWALPLVVACVAVSSWFTSRSSTVSVQWDLAETLLVLCFFAVGVLLAQHRLSIQRAWDESRLLRRVLLVSAFVFYGFSLSSLGVEKASTRILHGHHGPLLVLQDFAFLLAAAAWIIIARQAPHIRMLLQSPAALFLGRISYSLYLIHPLVLLSIAYLFRGLGKWTQFSIYVPLAVIVSWVFCIVVEGPMIRLSHRFASHNAVRHRDPAASSAA